MPDTILGGDFTVFYEADNNQKRVQWTGAATGTRTVNELYSALQDLFDEPAQMDDEVPINASTPDIYAMVNEWFIDDDSVEHLTGGSLFSNGWVDGTTEHVLTIGYTPTTELDDADIGRTIVGGTTGDTGTVLDFNTQRNLIWIRPDDPTTGGDEFDNGTEAFSIQNNSFEQVWQVDDDAGPAFVDETADANSATDADWDIFPATEASNDYVAVGFSQTFSKVIFDNGSAGATAGVGGAVTWEYWNGSAWSALSGVSDGTSGFTAAKSDGQELTYTVPTDWAERSLNGSAQLFYIRAVVSTTYSTNPVYDQGFIGGVGAGSFASHTRHGTGSVAGESGWVGVTSIGTIEENSHVYIFQEDIDQASGSWAEEKVLATKGSSDWWGDGQIDILLKTKEAGSVIGANPNDTTQGVATFHIRQYSKSYSLFIGRNLATAGGNTVVPFGTGDDLNNTTGFREMVLTDASGPFQVGEVIQDDDDSTIEGVVTSTSGSAPNVTLQYYLIGDPLNDFTGGSGTFTGQTSGDTATAVAPTNVGPANDTAITTTFGATTENINNGNGARPYSVRIDPASLSIERVYERMKFITRRGSVETLQGQDGEEYLGNERQIQYSAASGAFTEAEEIVGGTSSARAIVVADHNDGATGDVILKEVRGTFQNTETITGQSSGTTATVDSRRTVTPVGASPLGTFAGGTFFGAPGVTLTSANLAAGDEQAFQLIDDDGNTQIPPNTVSMTVTNLISGDSVAVFRRTGADINKTQFTLAAGNSEGNTTVVVNESIGADNPTNPNSKVRLISSSGDEHRYRYDSYSGSTFTLAPASTGTADGTSTNTTLDDAAATFITDEVEVGDYIRNTTDGVFVRVISVNSETQLTTEDGGVTWNAKAYSVNTLVEDYPQNNNAYVPYIERIADAASESNQLVQSTDVDVRAVVRNAGDILPFSQDGTISSNGLSVAAIRTADNIFVQP